MNNDNFKIDQKFISKEDENNAKEEDTLIMISENNGAHNLKSMDVSQCL
jgi:hypothetical protein